jgi:biotin carboxyl carrier protein
MNKDFEIKINDRLAKVELLKEEGNIIEVLVDGKKYEVDIVPAEAGYSILYKNKSYNLEIIEGENSKEFTVNTLYKSFNVDIVDAEYRYQQSRKKSKELEGGNVISSPMPGRIVRVPVKEGQEVEAGQTVVVVSAMKMESEYKSPKKGIVKQVHVKDGDIIVGHQPLVTIE